MIVCNCRDIRESDYPDKEELHDRIYCVDVVCGKCLEEFVDVDKIGHLGREFDSPHLHHKHTASRSGCLELF